MNTYRTYLPACDRDDCRYYACKEKFVKDKCSECSENCQRKNPIGYDYFESN